MPKSAGNRGAPSIETVGISIISWVSVAIVVQGVKITKMKLFYPGIVIVELKLSALKSGP